MLAFSEPVSSVSTDVAASGTWPLFLSHFHGVWTDPIIPLSVITGFCRSTRAAGEIAERLVELEALAKPLLDDVLKQLENWDPKVVAWQRLVIRANVVLPTLWRDLGSLCESVTIF